jgi:hypothetical protein
MSRLPRLSLLALCALLGSAFLFAGPADARKRGGFGPEHEPTEAQKAVHALRHEIAVHELYLALDLSPDQKASLAEIVADVVGQKAQRQEERAAEAPRLAALLEDWLAEVQSTGAPSASTVSAVRALREARRDDREDPREARQEIRARLESVLTDDQGEVLRSFRPMAAAGPSDEERAERRDARRGELVERAERRGISEDRAGDRIDERMEKGGRHHDRQAAMQNVRQLLFSEEMLALLD